MSVTEEERKKWYHAGPGDSFPIGPNGEQLKEAWDLAGHAANPDEVRAKIRAYAKKIGKEDLLPKTAQLSKARQEAVQALFHLAWNHEKWEHDIPQQHALARFAQEHGLLHLLPQEAHNTMHELGIPHTHDGMDEDHEHPVTKAYNPIGKSCVLEKAWGDGKEAFVEGWLSTPDRDAEGDIVEPEAFAKSMDNYFARRAPVSYIHNRQTLPAGHIQKAAIVREGKIIKAATHPTDGAEFEHFPGAGTGVYVRAIITEAPVADAIKKGNVGGFSFIGNGKTYTPLRPKGRHYHEIDPWIEATVAPYPINHHAVITVAKAYGLEEDQEQTIPMSDTLVKALEALLAAQETPVKKSESGGITEDRLVALLTQFKDEVLSTTETKIQKAMQLVREESGNGTKATLVKAELPEENPVYGLVQKARRGEEWTEDELHLANAVTYRVLAQGMNLSSIDSIREINL